QPDGGRSSAQRVRQRGSITQASGDLDGLPAVSISPFRVRVVSESAGQPGQDASAQSGFLGPHGRESFLKQGSQGPVTSCPSPYEATAVSEGGLGKQLGDPQVSRALGSMKEGLLRARSVAGSDERVAQGKEKRTSQLLIGGPLQVEGLEGHAVQPNGFLVREEPDSAVAGCPCVSNGSIHVATRRGLKEVVCQLRQVRFSALPVKALQRLAHPPVQASPMRRRDLLVQRLPDQDMGEAQSCERPWDLADDPSGNRLVQCLQDLVGFHVHDTAQRVEIELPAEDGGEAQYTFRLRRNRLHAPGDDLADYFGQG